MANPPAPLRMSLFGVKVEAVPSSPLCLQVFQDLLEQGQEDPMLTLVRQSRDVLDAQDETVPLDLPFTRLHLQARQGS